MLITTPAKGIQLSDSGGLEWGCIHIDYDRPLTHHEQDSINNDVCLIVYNDSTVFEFGGGVFGAQHFVGKEEFMENLHSSKMD